MNRVEIRCKAIVFDFDGVLVNSDPVSIRHWIRWAERHAISPASVLAVHHGRPTAETMQLVAPHLDVEDESIEMESVGADDTEGLTCYAGAHQLLKKIPADVWGIATSGRARTATRRIRYLGLPQPKVLVTSDDVAHGKPSPEPYQLAALCMGFDPVDCIAVEDAPAGVASAKEAGMRVIAITSTNAARDLAEADWHVQKLTDLALEISTEGQLQIELLSTKDKTL